ncbi:MAG: glycine--tRNA ligase subunit beta [Bryobacteraceae bacterium]
MADRFLLEIGVEEIPDWMIGPALAHLEKAIAQLFETNRLKGAVEWADATPRRLALLASGLPKGQKDSEDLVTGPPASAGQGAAQGFARKNGIAPEQLQVIQTPKGDYYGFRKKIVGRTTQEILAEALPGIILGIPWPKTMYWTGKGGPRFIRPIRWIVALLGSGVVPFEVAGVASGAYSQGHRVFGKKKIKVSATKFEDALRGNHVMLRAAERRSKIEAGIEMALAGKALRIKPDAALLDTLVYLTEWPTPILGTFDASYLSLPAEVLVTVMRHHQKYFSVLREDGSLAPHFVAVMNAPGDPEGNVASGNERVLRARFNDARFFWETDQKHPLAERVESLKAVTFQKELGSYHDKISAMALVLDEFENVPQAAHRAVRLCKCDLTCEMVKEFTDLQGIVGGLYARAQSEPEDVAIAIYDHYKPLSMEDTIPRSDAGRWVALADKLHSLRGCFGIGLAPTGSKDPFALRRAAQGVVKILVEGGMDIPVEKLAGGSAQLHEFLVDRIRYYFREIRGFKYDEVNAVLAAGITNLPDALARLEAIQAVRPTGDFEPLAASFKRIRNILEQAQFEGGRIDAAALHEDGERNLHNAMSNLSLAGLGYRDALEKIASLRPAVDLFFDKVLVNAPDPVVRSNRLALLDTLRREFSRIADFSEIVTA